MSQMDFEKDFREFRQKIGVRRIDVSSAIGYLEMLAKNWSQCSAESLDNIVSIAHDDMASRINGEVLGKRFIIHYAPIGLEAHGAVEVALSIPDLVTGEPIELTRFMITPKGLVLSPDGNGLIDLSYQGQDLKFLAAIASHVMDSPSKA